MPWSNQSANQEQPATSCSAVLDVCSQMGTGQLPIPMTPRSFSPDADTPKQAYASQANSGNQQLSIHLPSTSCSYATSTVRGTGLSSSVRHMLHTGSGGLSTKSTAVLAAGASLLTRLAPTIRLSTQLMVSSKF